MLYLSSASVTIILMGAVTVCSSIPAPHITGRGINGVKRIFLKNLFSPQELSLVKEVQDEKEDNTTKDTIKVLVDIVDNTDVNVPSTNYNENKLSGISVSANEMSRNNRGNPFLRVKRNVCQNPANLPQAVSQLNGALNATQFIGVIPTSSPRADIPSGQPDKCPNFPVDKWWPGHTDNLRSTCPWVYMEKDLGANAYPRYIREANCICDSCIDSTGLGCIDVRQTFTYFIIQSCQNGLALMNQVNTTITVGCQCSDAMPPPTATPAPTPRVTPTNDY